MSIKSCPKCKGPIDTSLAQSDGTLICPQCKSKLRIGKPRTSDNSSAAPKDPAKPAAKPIKPSAAAVSPQSGMQGRPIAPTSQDMRSQLPKDQAPFGHSPESQTVGTDPFSQDPFAHVPAATDPFNQDPFAQAPAASDPFYQDPFAQAPVASDAFYQDPFAQAASATDPFAQTGSSTFPQAGSVNSPWTNYSRPATAHNSTAQDDEADESTGEKAKLVLIGSVAAGGLIFAALLLFVLLKFLSGGKQGESPLAGKENANNLAAEAVGAGSESLEQFDPKPFRPMPGKLPAPSDVIIQSLWDVSLEPKQSSLDATAVGAVLPHEKYLFASQQGPFVVGYAYPPDEWESRNSTKPYDSPEKLASLTPYDVIDLRNGQSIGQFQVPFIRETDKLSPDGQHLLTLRMVENKYKWEVMAYQLGKPEPVLKLSFDYGVGYQFVGNDKLVLFSRKSEFSDIGIYDLKTAQLVSRLEVYEFVPTVDVLVSPDSKYLVLNPTLRVFSAKDGRKLGQLNTVPLYKKTESIGAIQPEITSLRFDTTGRYVQMAIQTRTSTRDGWVGTSQGIATWDFSTGELESAHVLPHKYDAQMTVCEGPEPNTLILGTRIIDQELGIPVGSCPPGIVASLGSNQYLAVGNRRSITNKNQLEPLIGQRDINQVIGKVAVDMDRFAASASVARKQERERLANNPKTLPPTIQMDRSQITKVALKAEPEWKVVPRAATPKADPNWQISSNTGYIPNLMTSTQIGWVDSSYQWHRYDLASGKPVGEPIRLDPRFGESVAPSQGSPSAAVSFDGQTLAVSVFQDTIFSSQIDIWSGAGERLYGFVPYGDKPVREFHFTDGGRLITSTHPRITCWDLVNKKAIYELTCDFASFEYLPFLNWLVVATKAGSVEFFDGEDGTHLGRLPIPGWQSISPDGKTLFRMVEYPQRPGIVTPEHLYWVEVWDLTTGKMSVVPETPKAYLGSIWTSNRQIISLDANSNHKTMVYDFDVHTHTHKFKFDDYFTPVVDPLGRTWQRSPRAGGDRSNVFRPVDLARENLVEGELVLGPGKPISISVDVDHPKLSPKIQLAYSKRFRDRGLVIGPGGFELKIWHSDSTYKHKVLNAQKTDDILVDFPLHIFHNRLSAPDGTVIWEHATPIPFSPFNSRYKRKEAYNAPVETTYDGRAIERASLDYGGRDPRLCQIEELLEDRSSYLDGYIFQDMPEFIYKTPSGYKTLPIEIELKP